eukprot:CAMPEP_0197036026 /NCGR_PEP_ID=MMETSP1384-20130603/13650_1 /TAXON_ID=29189 /ORGANISM="Ammonia sp." /LENGTH=242 /DNA_ID=CAMNT_0042466153 /DNA_START=320 /DNA_END=1048 /DNA_ORIENTATION=+
MFKSTAFELSTTAIVSFLAALITSSIIFLLLLSTNFKVPGTDSWVTCAITLCVFNLVFSIWITALFLSKLATVLKNVHASNRQSTLSYTSMRYQKLTAIITKTAILSFISMTLSFLSCLLLLFRFSLFGDNVFVHLLSEWIVALDVYSGFACYSLTFCYYDAMYRKLCSAVDAKCNAVCMQCILSDDAAKMDAMLFATTQSKSSIAMQTQQQTQTQDVVQVVESPNSETAETGSGETSTENA